MTKENETPSMTERFMIAIQDKTINTRYYSKHIFKDPNTHSEKCRLCKLKLETMIHVTGGCTILANSDNTMRQTN